jgi:hypothetical protein
VKRGPARERLPAAASDPAYGERSAHQTRASSATHTTMVHTLPCAVQHATQPAAGALAQPVQPHPHPQRQPSTEMSPDPRWRDTAAAATRSRRLLKPSHTTGIIMQRAADLRFTNGKALFT